MDVGGASVSSVQGGNGHTPPEYKAKKIQIKAVGQANTDTTFYIPWGLYHGDNQTNDLRHRPVRATIAWFSCFKETIQQGELEPTTSKCGAEAPSARDCPRPR